jgi:hypothetical protein
MQGIFPIHLTIGEGTMNAQPELDDNRLDQRYEMDAALVFSTFSSRRVPFFKGRTCNFSQRGLSFQSPRPLTLGQYIHMRFLAEPEASPVAAANPPLPKWHALAQVRWCRAVDSGSREYMIGIKFL